LGLLQAVRKFDPKRGIKFSYYASFWIKAYILKHVLDNRIVAERPLILKELGDRYQISRERIRQIQSGIIKNIRECSKAEISNFEENYSDLVH
jgi:RNA polymerase sigma-32 factor